MMNVDLPRVSYRKDDGWRPAGTYPRQAGFRVYARSDVYLITRECWSCGSCRQWKYCNSCSAAIESNERKERIETEVGGGEVVLVTLSIVVIQAHLILESLLASGKRLAGVNDAKEKGRENKCPNRKYKEIFLV